VARIYGRPDSELDIVSDAPDSVEKFEDIDIEHRKLKDELSQDKKKFFDNVPNAISKEEQKLVKMKNDEQITEQEFNEKLRLLEKKKAEGGLTRVSSSFKGYFVKNYSKRRAINKIKDKQVEQESTIKNWKENPTGIFNDWKHETISDIEEFDELKEDPMYAGAKGEVEVLKKLSELSNDFHVLCGVSKDLGKYITYRGRRNLRSAQMDFVVVSKRGVILIEVKNWSNYFVKHHRGLSPHAQVERAGMVLWISLKSSWRSPRNPKVTSVLLSVQNNMQFSDNYRFVNVKNLNNINTYIQNRYEIFSDAEVERLVGRLGGRH